MNILFVQTVFAPNQILLDKNIASLKSLSQYLTYFPYPVSCAFGGFSKDWLAIEESIGANVKPIVFTKFDRNYGKGYSVNHLVNEALTKGNFQYILTADSDIIFDVQCRFMLHRLVDMAKYLEKTKPLGLIGLNQIGAGVHSSIAFENKMEYTGSWGKENIFYPSKPGGIAGGCLFTPVNTWRAVNGYRVMDVYAGEDGWYLRDVGEKGYGYYLSGDIHVIHPAETDMTYAYWKLHQSHQSTGKITTSLDDCVKKVETFWATKK